MAKETAAQRRSRISALLADLDARSHELNKLTTIVKGLREQVREIEAGAYGEWTLAFGSTREILDQQAARKMMTDAGMTIPTTTTQPMIVITPKAGR